MKTTTERYEEQSGWVWSAGGKESDEASRGMSDAIEHCVLRLNPRPSERVLDLATGSGWTSRAVARRGATVVGVDTANELLHTARARASAEGLGVEYRIGDAGCLPFETGAFDAVVSTFGIMFASRPEAAAAELARVCRKGGRIAITTWLSDGSLFEMFEMMSAYLPSSPASPSPFEWGRIERIRELLGSQFRLRFERGVSYYREPSSEAAWDTFSRGYGPTPSLLTNLAHPQRNALRERFKTFHAGFPTELGICVPREYWLTVGLRV